MTSAVGGTREVVSAGKVQGHVRSLAMHEPYVHRRCQGSGG